MVLVVDDDADAVAVVPVEVVGSGNEEALVMVGSVGGEGKSVVEVKEKGRTCSTAGACPLAW